MNEIVQDGLEISFFLLQSKSTHEIIEFLKIMDSPAESSLIAEWFRDKVVFVTGSTGLVGRVLVEKLLRDCPEIGKCYLLMRTKRGVEPDQRREDYVNHMVSEKTACKCFFSILLMSTLISIDF